MKKFCLLLLAFSVNTFANIDKWNGTYHYYSSEELPGGNVATIEFILTLTPKKCEYSIAGFQVDKSANSNMRCDSLKSLMIINKLSKFL